MSIYRYDKRVASAIKGVKASEKITSANKRTILEFTTYMVADGKSLPRQDKLLRTVKILAELLGPIVFKEATKKDLVQVLAKYEAQVTRRTGKPASDHTRSDFKKITKQFYAWLFDIEDPRHEGYPKAVSWIRAKEPRSKLKASDLLTSLEVKKLIDATTDLRLKALIAFCSECGLRVGEVLKLKIKDVQLQEQCAQLTVSGKTGPRPVFSIESLPLLMQWLDSHPDRNNPDAWLWTDDTEPLTYDRARFMLSQCRKKAKIRKRVYWYLFRHSSATGNASLGESMLRKIYGWSKNSDEPGIYVHLSGEAVKKALLSKHGLKQKTEESKLIFCPRCNALNQPSASLCVRCRSTLSVQDAFSLSQLKEELKNQSELVHQLGFKINLLHDVLNKITASSGLPDWQTPEGTRKLVEHLKKETLEVYLED